MTHTYAQREREGEREREREVMYPLDIRVSPNVRTGVRRQPERAAGDGGVETHSDHAGSRQAHHR